MPRAAVVSVTHGGGPMPVLGDPMQKALADSMRTKVPKALKLNTPEAPRAIVLVTAHWETEGHIAISSGEKPDLYYDYGGFPDKAYELKYPAPGSKEVAGLVSDALKGAGFETRFDGQRGWDHGVFVPMMLINPSASIPIVQVSVLRSQSPSELFNMGRALAPLRDSNIAIVGSGSASFHNMQLLMKAIYNGLGVSEQEKQNRWNEALDGAILETEEEKRREKLLKWRDMEGAYTAHPRGRAEHFSPLIVCAAAGGEGKAGSWTDPFAGYAVRTYHWD